MHAYYSKTAPEPATPIHHGCRQAWKAHITRCADNVTAIWLLFLLSAPPPFRHRTRPSRPGQSPTRTRAACPSRPCREARCAAAASAPASSARSGSPGRSRSSRGSFERTRQNVSWLGTPFAIGRNLSKRVGGRRGLRQVHGAGRTVRRRRDRPDGNGDRQDQGGPGKPPLNHYKSSISINPNPCVSSS